MSIWKMQCPSDRFISVLKAVEFWIGNLKILNAELEPENVFTFTQMYNYIKTQKQLILQKDIPDTSCLCEVCENTCLMAKALKRYKKGHPTDAHHIMEKYCCDSSQEACINGVCKECDVMQILNTWESDSSSDSSSSEAESEKENHLSYDCWIRQDKKIKKVTTSKPDINEFYNEWKTSVLNLKHHIHRKRQQVSYRNCVQFIVWNVRCGEDIRYIRMFHCTNFGVINFSI